MTNTQTNSELSPSKDDETIRVSNSQISKYMRCQKKWWYSYGPLQLKEPPSKKAAMGTAVHAVLEAYLRDGTPIPDTPAGVIASVGLDKLRPAEELEIERSITLPLNEVSNMLCRIDMLGKNEPYVGDHKTTSDLKWVKTRAQVASDIQLLTYAYAGYHETKPDTVTGELIYYVREGQKVSMSVGAEFSWEDIEENWRLMGEIAREMLPRKTDPTGETCAGNPSACGDYGGCFFQDRCPVSPRNASKIKKEFAESSRRATNDNEINPEQEQNDMSGFIDKMMTQPNKRPTTDNGSTFGGFAAPSVHTPEPAPDPYKGHGTNAALSAALIMSSKGTEMPFEAPSVLPPEHPAPTRQTTATAPIFDDVKAAPVPAPVETVAQRKSRITYGSCGKKEQEEIGALFREHRMSHPANWEITKEQARSVVEDLIKKHTGRNMTPSRFDNVIKYAGYAFWDGLLVDKASQALRSALVQANNKGIPACNLMVFIKNQGVTATVEEILNLKGPHNGHLYRYAANLDTRLAPTEGPFNPGYTADPQAHDAEEISEEAQQWEALAKDEANKLRKVDREHLKRDQDQQTQRLAENQPTAAQVADREDYERRSGKTLNKKTQDMIKDLRTQMDVYEARNADLHEQLDSYSHHVDLLESGAPAISARCVLFVDVAHTGEPAKSIDGWLDPIKLQAKDAHPDGKTYASYLAADLDYGTGAKLLTHVLQSHTEAPAGLWTMRSSHKESEAVLATFERLGACIIYGN